MVSNYTDGRTDAWSWGSTTAVLLTVWLRAQAASCKEIRQ